MKTFIQNRSGQKLCVVVEATETPHKLAFVLHGLGGNKDEPQIRAVAEGFLAQGFTVVTFDTTNTFGESDGNYEDATVTSYHADLEDIISWASKQPWYREPFALAGHSLGGIAVALYAEEHPDKVSGLMPFATVVSGKLSVETYSMFPNRNETSIEAWEHDGVRITPAADGQPEKRLKWSHMEDRLKYDLRERVDQLTMPVLMVVGEKDVRTPPLHQQQLFAALPGRKALHIIPGADHGFGLVQHRSLLQQYVQAWAATL